MYHSRKIHPHAAPAAAHGRQVNQLPAPAPAAAAVSVSFGNKALDVALRDPKGFGGFGDG
jgi:hypothetical protein